MKKIIIIVIIVVSGYAYISDKVVGSGINSIKDHNAQLEMVMDSIN